MSRLNRQHDHVTRRSILLHACGSLLCAPAIVPVTSLMRVRSFVLPIESPQVGFVRRLMFHQLYCKLKSGRFPTMLNDSMVSEAEARRIVAYAFAYGFLPSTADSFVGERGLFHPGRAALQIKQCMVADRGANPAGDRSDCLGTTPGRDTRAASERACLGLDTKNELARLPVASDLTAAQKAIGASPGRRRINGPKIAPIRRSPAASEVYTRINASPAQPRGRARRSRWRALLAQLGCMSEADCYRAYEHNRAEGCPVLHRIPPPVTSSSYNREIDPFKPLRSGKTRW
jgi:hypothetical protein